MSNTELSISDESGRTQPGFNKLAGQERAFWTPWKRLKYKAKSITNLWSRSSLLGIQLQRLPACFEELGGKQQTSILICFPNILNEFLWSHILVQLFGLRYLLSESIPLILLQTRTSHDCSSRLPSWEKLKFFQSQTAVQHWGSKYPFLGQTTWKSRKVLIKLFHLPSRTNLCQQSAPPRVH